MSVSTTQAGWETTLVAEVKDALDHHDFWKQRFCQPGAIHLAVLIEPFLQYILDGRKTIESRFSVHRCAPYGQVSPGDIVLLKRSSGPIVGLCEVSHVWCYELEPQSWDEIRNSFSQALCAQDPSFWQARQRAAVATLMKVRNVTAITPLMCPKRDRRGWVVLTSRGVQLSLELE